MLKKVILWSAHLVALYILSSCSSSKNNRDISSDSNISGKINVFGLEDNINFRLKLSSRCFKKRLTSFLFRDSERRSLIGCRKNPETISISSRGNEFFSMNVPSEIARGNVNRYLFDAYPLGVGLPENNDGDLLESEIIKEDPLDRSSDQSRDLSLIEGDFDTKVKDLVSKKINDVNFLFFSVKENAFLFSLNSGKEFDIPNEVGGPVLRYKLSLTSLDEENEDEDVVVLEGVVARSQDRGFKKLKGESKCKKVYKDFCYTRLMGVKINKFEDFQFRLVITIVDESIANFGKRRGLKQRVLRAYVGPKKDLRKRLLIAHLDSENRFKEDILRFESPADLISYMKDIRISDL